LLLVNSDAAVKSWGVGRVVVSHRLHDITEFNVVGNAVNVESAIEDGLCMFIKIIRSNEVGDWARGKRCVRCLQKMFSAVIEQSFPDCSGFNYFGPRGAFHVIRVIRDEDAFQGGVYLSVVVTEFLEDTFCFLSWCHLLYYRCFLHVVCACIFLNRELLFAFLEICCLLLGIAVHLLGRFIVLFGSEESTLSVVGVVCRDSSSDYAGIFSLCNL